MGGNARERHGLFRFGAFVAARVHRPPQHQNAKSAPRCDRLRRIRGVAIIPHRSGLCERARSPRCF